jgi:hypothetical protein
MKQLIVTLFLLLGTFQYAFGEEKVTYEQIFYSGFKKVEYFCHINVNLQGSAEKIGLNKERLTDLAKLKFKNNFANINYKDESERLFDIYLDENKNNSVAAIYFDIWTVGDDYPVAYHISVKSGPVSNADMYTNAYLGYGSRVDVPETVKKAIADFMEELAISFFKARETL